MPIKISELPAAGALGGTEIVPLVQSGVTKRTTLSAIASFVQAAITLVTRATNLAGGANGSVPYQSAADTTAMLAAGSAGALLQTNGAGAPSWVTVLANGTTATTQSVNDNSTKVATTAYADRAASDTQAGRVELATTAEVQAGTDTARAVTPAGLQAGKLVSMGQVSASGSVVQFTSIPSWVRRITVQVDNVSPSTTARIYVQIGDAGGLEASGYASTTFGGFTGSSVSAESNTTGFFLNITGADAATNGYGGTMVLTLMDAASFKWICNGSFQTGAGTASGYTVTGYKSLTATLDRVALVTSAGTFDAGSVNILYE